MSFIGRWAVRSQEWLQARAVGVPLQATLYAGSFVSSVPSQQKAATPRISDAILRQARLDDAIQAIW